MGRDRLLYSLYSLGRKSSADPCASCPDAPLPSPCSETHCAAPTNPRSITSVWGKLLNLPMPYKMQILVKLTTFIGMS